MGGSKILNVAVLKKLINVLENIVWAQACTKERDLKHLKLVGYEVREKALTSLLMIEVFLTVEP